MAQTKEQAREIIEAITVCAEITGTDMSIGAVRVMSSDLSRYHHNQVIGALTRCRREMRNRLTLADILERLDDGRPGAQEAWAMVAPTLHNEDVTIVWTDEMRFAMGVASQCDDAVAARMAFLEHYRAGAQRARDDGVPVKWEISLGHDKNGRDGPLLAAVAQNKLLPLQVHPYLNGSAAHNDLMRIFAPNSKFNELVEKLVKPR